MPPAWKVLNQSVRGTSHSGSGAPCQDAELVATFGSPGTETDFLILVCSDGAGSAKFAEIGAATACRAALGAVAADLESCPASESLCSPKSALRWVKAAHDSIGSLAGEGDHSPRDFACTLLMAVLGTARSLFVQIGDGAIVSSDGEQCSVVFWPQNGEYANTTNFLTDPRYESLVQVHIGERVDEVSLLSDGLQSLALNYTLQCAHSPFFLPMFRMLRSAETPNDLQVPLRQFLESDPVNERTDDDKTLILATRLPA